MIDSKAMAQVFIAQTRALLYNLQPDVIADRKIKQQKIENCFYVEWEQDMGRKIPFCKITGEYCSGQCNFCQNYSVNTKLLSKPSNTVNDTNQPITGKMEACKG